MKLNFGGRTRGILITACLILAGVAGTYYYFNRTASAEDYLTAKIEKGSIRRTVTATGTLQAVKTVQVGSQVSGTISALYADFNSVVKKGQLVAQLDPALFQAQVAQARANRENSRANLADSKARLLAAEATLANQKAGVSSAKANLAALKAQRDDAARLLERQEALARGGIIAERDLESVKASYEASKARYDQAAAQLEQAKSAEESAAKAGLEGARAQVKQAEAQVKQTEAALQLAEVNLSHTTITSPIDGVVVSRNVDVGQTVAASLSAPTLFTIANDLTQMWVIANVDQADIGVINNNNRVSFTVDAFPGENFRGIINQIRLSPLDVQNVVTYQVVIDVQNKDLKLKPGMTANLTFTIDERNDVLKVPNSALRFRPQDVTQEKIREIVRAAGGSERPAASPPAQEQKKPEGGIKPAGSQGPERTGRQPGEAGGRQGEKKPAGAPAQAGAPSGGREGGGGGFAPTTSAVLAGQKRVVWVLGPDKKPQPRVITIGITDGVTAEITEGGFKEGDLVIVGQNISSNSSSSNRAQTPPGFGGAPGGGPGGRPGGFGGGGGTRR